MEETKLCRLCFNVEQTGYEEINGIMKEMLDILLVDINLNIVKNPIICYNCTRIVQRSFSFKSDCIQTERNIVCFAIDREKSKFELREIFHNNKNFQMFIEEHNSVCRFCMNQLEENNWVPLEILMKNMWYMEMLSAYMPEMDFSLTNDPVICDSCKEDLEHYFELLRNCLHTKRKIFMYCKNKGANSMGCLKTVNILPLLSKDVCSSDDNTQIYRNERRFTCSDEIGGMKCNKLIKMEEVMDIKNEEVLLNTESLYVEKRNDAPGLKWYRCATCNYETKYKHNLKSHMVIHKNSSEVPVYNCTVCNYRSKWRAHLKRHMVTHKGVPGTEASQGASYKSPRCGYKTARNNSLGKHMTPQRDTLKVDVYKCIHCAYETKSKSSFTMHLLIHRDPSEAEVYKCPFCTYDTLLKGHFRKHLLMHENKAMLKYKCASCTYEAKRKVYLHKHMLIHRDDSEVETYKCSFCSYVAKRRFDLQRHLLIHKDDSEVEMYKCTLCPYVAKVKYYLQKHMLIHKDHSEVEVHRCEFCTYVTKRSNCLKKHMLIHKDPLEIQMYKCNQCGHKAKRKDDLKRHLQSHKDVGNKQTNARNRNVLM